MNFVKKSVLVLAALVMAPAAEAGFGDYVYPACLTGGFLAAWYFRDKIAKADDYTKLVGFNTGEIYATAKFFTLSKVLEAIPPIGNRVGNDLSLGTLLVAGGYKCVNSEWFQKVCNFATNKIPVVGGKLFDESKMKLSASNDSEYALNKWIIAGGFMYMIPKLYTRYISGK